MVPSATVYDAHARKLLCILRTEVRHVSIRVSVMRHEADSPFAPKEMTKACQTAEAKVLPVPACLSLRCRPHPPSTRRRPHPPSLCRHLHMFDRTHTRLCACGHYPVARIVGAPLLCLEVRADMKTAIAHSTTGV